MNGADPLEESLAILLVLIYYIIKHEQRGL